MRSAFKVSEVVWLDDKSVVKRLKTRPLWGYLAYNEDEPAIDIKLSGPDDRGIQKDIIIDLESLIKEMKRTGVI